MGRIKKLLYALFILFFLVGCNATSDSDGETPKDTNNEEVTSDDGVDKPSTDDEEEAPEVEETPVEEVATINIQEYFPPENVIKHFRGEGNEYASEVETIFQREGEFLVSLGNNGGTQVLRVYQLTQNGIHLVYEVPEYYEESPPSVASLQEQFQIQDVLTVPVEKGRMINGWEIVDIAHELTLPIGTLNDVIVLEKTNGNESMNRHYWAKQYGLVKKEFYYKNEDAYELMVTTELEKVEELPQ
ncbi:hypothetical protein [Robertmurraya kyonggiensis]|uniref:Uncharacterized protein n=1 Tax=Robertmurraya kyonggiensis TaxID=1037680 RepID=A0A4U1D316_9BACI|nr:hypothetical protein [Robertmurraya kyonggiensis]TKC15466.1 hypothetical protein FA727_18765 [Robertmurraya kyonggiensis]